MYTVTFYSFKGGVGRTMALVNVGFELARTGRRVLLVDFDLEAPGLETFMDCHDGSRPGLVDYVDHYLRENRAPDIADYISSCTLNEDDSRAQLWLMSAGRRDADYGKKLSNIDWKSIYTHRDGYLLLEHMKEQWHKHLQPDYVLIDSRTGYTEEGGICTRQLPDAVVAMFFPNNQNLNGLQSIVHAIQRQTSQTRRRIKMHMVAANVPNLDDEHRILEKTLERCKKGLNCSELTSIHYYNHVDLVEQSVFTIKHAHTTLAAEYRQLTEKIVEENVEDAAGAKVYLGRALKSNPNNGDIKALKERVAQILFHHSKDTELLRLAADLYSKAELYDESYSVLDQILELEPKRADILARRAYIKTLFGLENDAQNDVLDALRCDNAKYAEYMFAIHLLRRSDRKAELIGVLEDARLGGRLANLDPSARIALTMEMMSDTELVPIAAYISETLCNDDQLQEAARTQLILCLIHMQQYEPAMKVLGDPEKMDRTPDLFNYAMASWALSGAPSKSLFRRVADIARKGAGSADDRDANTHQCFALTYWAMDDLNAAKVELDDARRELTRRPGKHFSAWRYLYVTREEFNEDCDELAKLVDGRHERPKFMTPRSGTNSKMLH